jgi:hypothetical protein
VPVVFLIAIVAVLVGIFFAATGRGGELAYEHADHAPLDLGPVTAADVALLRPPTALWGYNVQVTDEALDQIARAVRERDITIAYLQEQLASSERNGSYPEARGAHDRHSAGLAPFPEAPEPPGLSGVAETFETQPADALGVAAPAVTLDDLLGVATPEGPPPAEASEAFHPAEASEASEAYQPAEAPEASQLAEAPDASEAAFEPAEPFEPAEFPGPPRTPLVLRASPGKAPQAPEPYAATQPSGILQDPGADDLTQPVEIHDPTQASAALAPDQDGPQGDFNAHDWWAEQREAARGEEAGPPAGTSEGHEPLAGTSEGQESQAGTGQGHEGDPRAAAEEQSW